MVDFTCYIIPIQRKEETILSMAKVKKAKLGFVMKLFQILFILNISLSIFIISFLSKDLAEMKLYGFGWYMQLINLVCDGIAFMLIFDRKKAAIPFIVISSAFFLTLTTVHYITNYGLDYGIIGFGSVFYIALILYFLISKRPRQVLTEEFHLSPEKKQATIYGKNFFRPKTWAFWRNIIIYFCIFSVVGHWCEAFYCTLQRFKIIPGGYDPTSQIWSDWLFPFPIYGLGAVACIIIFYPIRMALQKKIKKTIPTLIISFVVSVLVCSAMELIMGLIMNTPPGPDGRLPLWDYSNRPFNFMGQVCLQNSTAFGLVATAFTWLLYPGLEEKFAKVSKDTMQIVFIAILVFFIILYVFYCVKIVDWNEILHKTSSLIRAVKIMT